MAVRQRRVHAAAAHRMSVHGVTGQPLAPGRYCIARCYCGNCPQYEPLARTLAPWVNGVNTNTAVRYDPATGNAVLVSETTGETLRDNGLRVALDAAPDPWAAQAKREIVRLASQRVPFTSEDVTRSVGLPRGTVSSNANNAVGALIAAASRRGLIVRTGQRVRSKRASSHAAELTEWVGP